MPTATLRSVAAVALFALATVSCAKDDYVRLYHSEPKAPEYSEDDIKALAYMGPTFAAKGVNFAVYSEKASRIELMLFDDPESNRPTRTFEMKRFGDVWNVYVEGIGYGQHYGYRAWGPNWEYDPAWYPSSVIGFKADVDGEGNRFNPNKLLFDPYSKALHRDHDWSKGSIASGPSRAEVTYAAASKSVIVESKYEWSENEAKWREARKDPNMPGHREQDVIVYEVHLKGFTASPASGVEHPGTYRGVGEKAAYFKELGITAVEFLPIHEKPIDGGYWGYQTLNFFAPELSYAWAKDPGERIDEFKWMVDQLHQHGIEVWIDVVYNHTGEGGLWRERIEYDDHFGGGGGEKLVNLDPKEVAGLYAYRGLDNQAYYALSADGQTYWNNTGVGNETRCNHKPMRRLITDSLRYWVEEMHVDGFRFDLAPVLGEKDKDYTVWDDPKNTVLQDIIDADFVQQNNVRIVAEPWSLAGAYVGQFPASTTREGYGWGEWNGRFRDWWRAFINDDDWKLNSLEGDGDGGFVMTASDRWYKHNGRKPFHSYNFVTVHDGFTLYDVFTYPNKQNKCGPLNPVCCDQPLSAWCDKDSGESHNRSRDWGASADGEAKKRQMMRNAFAAMLFSHGTPMLYGGDEWMRTQLGNNNAYSTRADNPYNWFDWGSWQANDEKHRMFDFVKDMIALRKKYGYALAPAEYGGGAPFAWKSRENTDQVNWSGKSVMIHYYDASVGPELAILINMENDPLDFTLPGGRTWHRLVDTQDWFDKDPFLTEHRADRRQSQNISLDAPEPITDAKYGVPSRTIVILEGR